MFSTTHTPSVSSLIIDSPVKSVALVDYDMSDGEVSDASTYASASEIQCTPQKKRGRPKKFRTPEELAAMEAAREAKMLRKLEREAKKAAKDAEPKLPRGRPKKERTPEELAAMEAEEEAKLQRKLEREAKKAAKAAEPKRPRGRPKKERTPEELAAMEAEEEAKLQRKLEREAKKAAKDAERAMKQEMLMNQKKAKHDKMVKELEEYKSKWNL